MVSSIIVNIGLARFRVEDIALAQKRTRSKPHRDGIVVGFVDVFRIEADEIDRLLTLHVYDPQNFALANDVGPWLAWCDHDVPTYCSACDQGRLLLIPAT
jgi:hypothetical protein